MLEKIIFVVLAVASLYLCIAGGEATIAVALVVMVAIVAVSVALIALALIKEIAINLIALFKRA